MNTHCALLPVSQGSLEQLRELFRVISQDAAGVHFHPHPFDAAQADHIHHYQGEDVYVLLLHEDVVAGYALLRGWDAGYAVPSLGIYILPEKRGQGLARHFMTLLHKTARRKGARRIRLKVYSENCPAVRLYEGLGYVFNGRHELGQRVGELILDEDSSPLPGITVVVPSFNQGRFIDHTLRSLLDQGYPKLEILVMDGGSTDDTVERLKAYGSQIQWVSRKDKGQTDALIKGFNKAVHPWLTWLNSDDFHVGRALHSVADAILTAPGAEIVIGNGHYANPDGTYLRPYPRVACAEDTDMCEEFFARGYVAQPSVYFKKDAYFRVGGINPDKHLCMDYDLWVRFAVHGCRFMAIEEDISGNRWYEDTKTSSQLVELYSEMVDTQQRWYRNVSPYLVQALSDYYAVLLGRKAREGFARMTSRAGANFACVPSLDQNCIRGGERLILLARWALFKCVALWLLWKNPRHLWGLWTGPHFKKGGALGRDVYGILDILRLRRD